MSAKKLGRFAAGLLVVLGLAFGGTLLAGGKGVASDVVHAAVIGGAPAQFEYEWH
jgi:hypothetical protein